MTLINQVANALSASLIRQANDEGGYINMMGDGIARIDGDFSVDALA